MDDWAVGVTELKSRRVGSGGGVHWRCARHWRVEFRQCLAFRHGVHRAVAVLLADASSAVTALATSLARSFWIV